MNSSQLIGEINEQPATLARLLDEGWTAVNEAARRIRAFGPDWVVIAARGTSDNAARYAQYLFGAHNGLGVGLAAPSLFTLYGAPPYLGRALTIGISQSGQSPDVVEVVTEARRQGGVTLAITNDPTSPLAAASHVTIRLAAGEEHAVAATKTYTNQLLALAMLSVALEDESGRREAISQVPAAVSQVLQTSVEVPELAVPYRDARQFVVLGRGFNYCTAFEVALKMKETSYVLADPYSVADFQHGPMALIEPGFPALVIAPAGRAADNVIELVDRLEERQARVIAFSDRADVLDRADAAIPLPPGVEEWLSPIVAIVPGQLWANALARAKGIDPDNPRGLSKVTLTH